MKLLKAGNGEYYVNRISKGSTTKGMIKNRPKIYRNWFFIKHGARINMGGLHIPKDFVGKKIRFKVEVVEDDVSSNGEVPER